MKETVQYTESSLPLSDGRRARGRANRSKILAALMALVQEGITIPTAEQVSDRAGVGLRTVFRHFDDMESLYREISTEIMKQISPLIAQPLPDANDDQRLVDIVERRARVFEIMLPFQRAVHVHRYRSPFLSEEAIHTRALESATLRNALPARLVANPQMFDALNMVLSFSAWQRLRDEQGLSITAAKNVVRLTAAALVAKFAD